MSVDRYGSSLGRLENNVRVYKKKRTIKDSVEAPRSRGISSVLQGTRGVCGRCWPEEGPKRKGPALNRSSGSDSLYPAWKRLEDRLSSYWGRVERKKRLRRKCGRSRGEKGEGVREKACAGKMKQVDRGLWWNSPARGLKRREGFGSGKRAKICGKKPRPRRTGRRRNVGREDAIAGRSCPTSVA